MSSPSPAGPSAYDLDQLLRLAAPVQDSDLSTHATRQAISGMAHSVASEPRAATAPTLPIASLRRPEPARSRRRRTVAGISLASAVWALSATGVAAAGGLALYSGFVDSPGSTESVQGEQYVNVGSPQFQDAFAEITTNYPLPTGESYAAL